MNACLENISESGDIVRCGKPIPSGTILCKEHNQKERQYLSRRISSLLAQVEQERERLRSFELQALLLP